MSVSLWKPGSHEPLGKDIYGIYDKASVLRLANDFDSGIRADLETTAKTAATATNHFADFLADFHNAWKTYSNILTRLEVGSGLTEESRRELQTNRDLLRQRLVAVNTRYRNLRRQLDAMRNAQHRLLAQRTSQCFASIRRLPAVTSSSVRPNGNKSVRLTRKRPLFLAARALRIKPERRGLVTHFWLLDLDDLKPGQCTLVLSVDNALSHTSSELALTEQAAALPAPPELPAALLTGDVRPQRRAPLFQRRENRECSFPEPIYPLEAQQQRWEGKVELFVGVETNGVPSTVEIQSSSGHLVLDREVVNHIQRRWRWPKAEEPRQYIVLLHSDWNNTTATPHDQVHRGIHGFHRLDPEAWISYPRHRRHPRFISGKCRCSGRMSTSRQEPPTSLGNSPKQPLLHENPGH